MPWVAISEAWYECLANRNRARRRSLPRFPAQCICPRYGPGLTIFMGYPLVHILLLLGYVVAVAAGIMGIFWLARQRALPSGFLPSRTMPAWGTALLALGIILFELISLKLSSPPVIFWDFLKAYYPAGQAALQHDPQALKALIAAGVEGGFVNIPGVAYLFVPFVWLPPRIAGMLFTVIGVGSTVVAWLLLVRLARLDLRERWLLALLFLANGPLINGLKFGNVSYILIIVMAAGLALIRAHRSATAGVLLGVAAILKPPLAIFGLFFLWRRDWPGVLGLTLAGTVSAALSLILFGWATNLYWLQTTIFSYSQKWLAGSSVQSIDAFLLRLHEPPEILLNWSAQAPGPGEEVLAQGMSGLILLVAVGASLRRRSITVERDAALARERQDLQYLLAICLCLLWSPLSWAHYYAWLLIPAAFFLKVQARLATPRLARIIGWAAIILVTPVVLWTQSVTHSTVMTVYASFIVSHYLFGGLLWFGLIAWWLARTGGLLAAASSVSASSEAPRAVVQTEWRAD